MTEPSSLANSDSIEGKMRCVSVDVEDRMYTDRRCNNLYAKADRGRILILVYYHHIAHPYCCPSLLNASKTDKQVIYE